MKIVSEKMQINQAFIFFDSTLLFYERLHNATSGGRIILCSKSLTGITLCLRKLFE